MTPLYDHRWHRSFVLSVIALRRNRFTLESLIVRLKVVSVRYGIIVHAAVLRVITFKLLVINFILIWNIRKWLLDTAIDIRKTPRKIHRTPRKKFRKPSLAMCIPAKNYFWTNKVKKKIKLCLVIFISINYWTYWFLINKYIFILNISRVKI